MKKEDAIKYLQQLYPQGGHCWLDEQRIEAIGMAVKALNEKPVTKDKFTFTSLPRLLDRIKPTDRAKWYSSRLADVLEKEGYITDAKIVRESIKIMNGEKVPMATMDEEPVSEYFENALAEEWKGYNDRGAAKVDALEDNTQELAFAKGFYRGWHYKKEEPVSEDLGEYINELSKQFPEVSFAKLSRIAVRVAKWQEKQDQSTIELAEDHAMLAGMNKMEEQMMAKAKSGTVQKDNQVILDDGTYMDLDPSMQLKPSFVGLKEGDRIKVILIKED